MLRLSTGLLHARENMSGYLKVVLLYYIQDHNLWQGFRQCEWPTRVFVIS